MCSMDYTLLDSGEGKKLESFGPITLIRPSYAAIWPKSFPNLWEGANAEYRRRGEEGEWYSPRSSLPQEWRISFKGIDCTLKPTSFGHLGVFPEHSGFWPWLKTAIDSHKTCRVLNLFAYTGATSIFAAQCGAYVCHVDSSRAAVRWAQKNVENNSLPEKRIFWIIEDVFSFLKREIRRKKKYDVLLLDPPSYGRGTKGEIFKIDRDFVKSYAGVGSDDCYLFNPNLVGRGSWNDLKNLRHTITREWDFENLEVRENLEIEEEYLGLDEIKNNQKQYQVKEINQEHDETTKVKNTEIVIEEKNNSANNQYSFDKKEEPSINKKVLISNDTQPSLFDENQKEQEARLFIEKYAGILTGGFDPTKSAKELKREKLDKDLEEGRI